MLAQSLIEKIIIIRNNNNNKIKKKLKIASVDIILV
jgi:hypothetical protein